MWHTNTSGLRALRSKSLESFINHFKGRAKRWCKINGHPEFDWQPKFHDRIIRDFKEYEGIIAYVQHNVAAWEQLYNAPKFPPSA